MTKRIGRVSILDGVDLEVAPATLQVIHGANGRGKTTLLLVSLGLLRASSGSVTRPRRLGFAPEHYLAGSSERLLTHLQRLEVLRGPSRGKWTASELVNALDLGQWASHPLRELSKGTLRRVGVAQAFLALPDLVVLDEPTDGLDGNRADDLKSLIGRGVDEGAAVLIATHDENWDAAQANWNLVDGRLRPTSRMRSLVTFEFVSDDGRESVKSVREDEITRVVREEDARGFRVVRIRDAGARP